MNSKRLNMAIKRLAIKLLASAVLDKTIPGSAKARLVGAPLASDPI